MDVPFPRRHLALLTALVTTTSVATWLWVTFVTRREARIDADGRVGNVFDDAYMFVRYADHVLAGQGVAWNAGEGPVHGNTSALYLAELVGVRALFHGDAGHVALIGSMTGAVLALVAITWMLAELGRAVGAPNPGWSWAALAFPMVLGAFTFRFHAITGMDTTLALALVAAVIGASARVGTTGSNRDILLCGGLGWLAIEARHDDGIMALAAPIGVAWASGRWRAGLWSALLVVGLSAVSVGVKFGYYGDPMPLALYVKRSGFYDAYLTGWRWNPAAYLLEIAGWTSPFWLIWLLGARRERARLYVALLAPTLLTWGTFFGVVQIMGFHARYYVPAAAGIIALGGVAAVDIVRTRRINPLGLIPAIGLGILVISPATVVDAYERLALTRETPRPDQYYRASGALPVKRINPSTQGIIRILRAAPVRLGATEYGLIGAKLPDVPILDLAGLHDPQLAHGGFSMDRVLEVAPPLIWMPFPDYDGMTRTMYCDPRFWEEYDVYPGAFRFGIAVRKDAPRALKEAASTEFAKFYPGQALDEHRARPRPEGCR